MKNDEIISRINYFRNEKHLSARELSLKIFKNRAYINHLESGKFSIKTSILSDIIDALNIPCEKFFAENYREYELDKEILQLFKNLSLERKKALIEFLKDK